MNDHPTTERPWHWGRALWKIAVGVSAAWALFYFGIPARLDGWWEVHLGRDNFVGHRGNVLMFAVLSLPVVLAAIGLLELSLRRPFRQIAASWDALPEWARGLLFLLLTVGSFALLVWAGSSFANRP